MRSTNKSFKLKKALNEFRLAVATVIISNGAHLDCHTTDISDISDIAELCDQYALMILLNWLGTKCGFPICKQAIDQEMPVGASNSMPLLSWASLAERYPFHLYETCILSNESISNLFFLLDERIPSQLEIAGDLYQQIVSIPLAFSQGKLLGLSKQGQERVGGEFYTPSWVADLAFKYWNRMQSNPIDKNSIYDPSCGSGNFLLAAVRNASKQGMNPSQFLSFIANDLYGSDVDGKAVCLARVLVLLEMWNSIGQTQCDLDVDDLYTSLAKNIRVKDSLLEGLCENKVHYDLVITNPPYISFGSRDQETLGRDWQRFLKAQFPSSSQYKIRYSSIFQEIGLASIKEGGQAIFFVPDAFLTGEYYQKLRNLILEKTQVLSLSELPEKTMTGVTVGRWCLAQYRLKQDANRNSGKQMSLPDSNGSNGTRDESQVLVRSFAHHDDPGANSVPKEFTIPFTTLLSKEKNRFQLVFSRHDMEILEACNNMDFLKAVLQGRTGIRARAGQNSVLAELPKSPLHRPGIISGSELRAFSITWAGNFIEVNPAKLFAGGFDQEVISNPKILLRQTGDSLIAAIDLNGFYHLNNVHSFSTIKKSSSKKKVEPSIVDGNTEANQSSEQVLGKLVCLLNSAFYKYFYGLKTREQKMALAQIDIETVEHMPLPHGFLDEADELNILASEINDLCSNDNFRSSKAKRKDDSQNHKLAISQKLSKVDRIIFELFGLSGSQQKHVSETLAALKSKV